MTTKLRSVLILCLASFLFAVCVQFTIVTSRTWILTRDAASTGMDWARHLEARIPNLRQLVGDTVASGEAKSGVSKTRFGQTEIPRAEDLTRLVSDVLAIGNIYQIDFINADCLCELSFGTFQDPIDGLRHGVVDQVGDAASAGDHKGHAHALKPAGALNIKLPPQSLVKHVFGNRKKHPLQKQSNKKPSRLDIDRPHVLSVLKDQSQSIRVRDGRQLAQPSTFAEVYYPIISQGKTDYVMRVLVNLAERSHLYTQMLYIGAVMVVILLLMAFGYPARQLLRTSRRQKATDQRAHHLANHDALTGIANRNAFQDQVPKRLAECDSLGCPALLYLIDVNNFKDINDYHGHHVGDMVLVALAERLSKLVPPGSFVARLGGDEFAISMCGVDFIDTAADGILDIPKKFDVEIKEQGISIPVGLSAGLARFPRDGENIKQLMQHADLALYRAKEKNDNCVAEFHSSMGAAFKHRMSLFDDFRLALEKSQFEPHYQPLVNLCTGKVEGFEALARWYHPVRGVLAPSVFHQALEDQQLSSMLGTMMLEKVTRDAGRWKALGVDFQSVGINIGEGDLMRVDLVSEVSHALAVNGLEPSDIAIEVTENIIFGKHEKAGFEILNQLRDLGCYIALDDFGTGYSSITHIKELPCTAVKVDKSFVHKVVDDAVDQAIIKALLTLGKTANFKLVIEGVETLEQLELVRFLGCQLAQGYYYSKPVPAIEVPDLIPRIHHDFGHNLSDGDEHLEMYA